MRRQARRGLPHYPYSPVMIRYLLAAPVGLTVLLSFAHSQQFAPANELFPGLLDPSSPVAADLDGDGDHDLLLISFQQSEIVWYENLDGNGTGERHVISESADIVQPSEIAAGDLDGDGDVDVAVAGSSPSLFGTPEGSLLWFENLGGGSFGPAQTVKQTGPFNRHVNLADMDNDGDLDILSTFTTQGCYFNNGQGQFSQGNSYPTGDGVSIDITPADIDGDGLLDIVTVNNGTDLSFGTLEWGRVYWNRNLGSGQFSSATLLLNTGKLASAAVADLEGDGDLDILVSNPSQGIQWLKSLGGGNFEGMSLLGSTALPFDPASDVVEDMIAADVDADGDLDVICANGEEDPVTLYLNLGNSIVDFAPPQVLAAEAADTSYVLAMQFNSDQLPELVVTSSEDDQAIILPNLGGGTFGSEIQVYEGFAGGLDAVPADLDGDGDLDVLSSASSGDRIVWFENTGTGDFVSPRTITTELKLPLSIEAQDLDGDGDLDVLGSGFNNDSVAWIENLGSGQFGATNLLSSDSVQIQRTGAADLDGDGDLDIYAISRDAYGPFETGSGGRVSVFENQGAGVFGPEQALTTAIENPQGVDVVDLDGDGDLDLLVCSQGPDQIAWLENAGTGSFAAPVVLSSECIGIKDVEAADLDGDGIMDLLFACLLDDEIAWQRNLGNVSFGAKQTLVSGSLGDFGPFDVDACDLNGDGDPDILFTSLFGSSVGWIENFGQAQFGPSILLPQDVDQARNIAAGDLTGNGALDVLVASQASGVVLFPNLETATDCNANGILDSLEIGSGSVADCDGNGRPDECDLSEPGADINGNGVLDACESLIVSLAPSSNPSALSAPVTLVTLNVPDTTAELVLDRPNGELALPIQVFGGVSMVDIPPLGFASGSDVHAEAFVRWIDAQGAQSTVAFPDGFTWAVPTILGVEPSVGQFDESTSVTIELTDNVLLDGQGQARFGVAGAMPATFSSVGGMTFVTTTAPPQTMPGDYPIELELTVGSVTEFSRVDSRAFLYVSPGLVSVSSLSGFQAGGEALTFELSGFEPGISTDVSFGGLVVSGVPTGALDQVQLTVFTPFSAQSGMVDVTITQDVGGGDVNTLISPGLFEYLAPEILAFTPDSGPQAGSNSLTGITAGFLPGAAFLRVGTTDVPITLLSTGGFFTTLPPSAVAGSVDLQVTQGVLQAEIQAAYSYLAPNLSSLEPNDIAWYDGGAFTLQGSNFSPLVPAQVSIADQVLVTAVINSSNQATFTLSPDVLSESGVQGLKLIQEGVEASLSSGLLVLPSLSASIAGDVTSGGSVSLNLETGNPGFGYVLISPSITAAPVAFTEIHGILDLDLSGISILAAGVVPGSPVAVINVPPGILPPGTQTSLQGLVGEATPQGTLLGFTQAITVTLL